MQELQRELPPLTRPQKKKLTEGLAESDFWLRAEIDVMSRWHAGNDDWAELKIELKVIKALSMKVDNLEVDNGGQ